MVCFLVQCGSKGPLQQVPIKNPLPITEFSVEQKGNFIYLQWEFPSNLSDKKTSLEEEKIKYVHIFSSNQEFTSDNYSRKAKFDYKLKLDKLSRLDNYFKVKFPKKHHELNNKKYYFAIKYKYKQKKSPLSKIIPFDTLLTAKNITGLSLKQEQKVIILNWIKPQENIADEKLHQITGYNIYRSVDPKSQKNKKFKLINKNKKILSECYHDDETSQEGAYSYYVVTTHGEKIESLPSNLISVTIKNIYPPAPPQNLVCVSFTEGLQLFWEGVKDHDLAFYKIYRKSDKDFEYSVLVKETTKSFFKDTDVKDGTTYFYQVTAFDTAGNESDPSNTAREKVKKY